MDLATRTGGNPEAQYAGWSGPGAHPLGASYLGVEVCGPRPAVDGAPDVVSRGPGWGEYEWECVELAMRFMWLIYGVRPYPAERGQRRVRVQPERRWWAREDCERDPRRSA